MIQFRSKMNKYLELALGIPDALVYMLAQAGSDDMHLIMDRRSTASHHHLSTHVKKRTDDSGQQIKKEEERKKMPNE